MDEYGLSEQGAGLCLRPSHRGVRRGVRDRRLFAGQQRPAMRGAVGHSPALRRFLCGGAAAGRQSGRFFLWGVQHPGGAGHGVSVPVHPVLRPEVVRRAARGWPPASSAGAVGLSGAFLTVFVRTALQGFGPVQGIRGAFWALGAIDPAGLPCGQSAAQLTRRPKSSSQNSRAERQKPRRSTLLPWQMLGTKQYWLCAGAVCFSTPAVLLFSPIILKLGMERGLDETRCAVERGAGQRGQCGGAAADAHAQR